MQYLLVLVLVFSVILPKNAEAFTSGLFKIMQIGGNEQKDEQTSPELANIDIDLLIEADTYVPSFYKGRAEPTAGSSMRLAAIPSDYGPVTKYLWNVNGNLLNVSDQTITITVPSNVNEMIVTVSAIDQNGNSIGKTTEYIPVSLPSVSFYEVNPLRGASSIAIAQRLNLIGEEVSVRAEPYFLNNQSLSELSAKWNTGDLKNVQSENWNTVSILKEDGASNTRVVLQLTNFNNLSENMSSSFILGI